MRSLAAKVDFIRQVQERRGLLKLAGHKVRSLRKRLSRQAEPNGIRRTYFARLQRSVLAAMLDAVQRGLVPKLHAMVAQYAHLHHQDEEGNINAAVDAVSGEFFDEWSNERFSDVARPIALVTSAFQKDQLSRQLQSSMSVNVVKAEPWLAPTIDAFVAENVALIKSIPQQFFTDLEKTLSQGIADGERPEELQARIQDRFNVAESRAALIARDQVGKFYGDLNETRQTALGIVGYVWRTSRDERVREEHAMREGRSFKWEDPPEDGNPGEPVNCRCFAEPDLGPILDQLEE